MIDLSTNEGRGHLMLGLVRIVLGFMFVWAFFDKLLGLGMLTTSEAAIINGGSPTEYYLSQLVSGPFEGMWHALAGNAIVDFLLMFGLIAVGVCLMLGIASKLSTIGMVIMMALMYTLCVPPSDNPLVDYHILYILAALAVYFLNGFSYLGFEDKWRGLGIVKKIPLLE
ncbi:MAG: hypothetical protein ACI38Y_08105 [Candidatus Methanomethylophilaceae archaeon]